jgi:VWFA-related protein
MRNTAKFLSAGAFALLLGAGVSLRPADVHAQAPQPAATAPAAQTPTFRATVELVTTDVIPRDSRNDQFIADLKPGEFEVYEDGVKQDIVSMSLIHGGRAYNVQAPPPAPVREGIILPRSRPTNDAAGRIFLIFIDDLHLDFGMTPRLRSLLKDMLKDLIHDGDMFGIVSTGTSSIEQQLTYDRQILESISVKAKGEALKPSEIIQSSSGVGPASELRHRAQVAFQTAYDLVTNLQKVQNRRKAVIYISSGYDFNPFEQSRIDHVAEIMHSTADDLQQDPFYQNQRSENALQEGDLYKEEAELIRAANRANATFYTIDPRGLVAGQDMAEEIDNRDFQEYLRESQDSLRTIADNTGGFAIVNQNDFRKGLKRIDAETSDYYVLGFYSSNPDVLKRVRRLEVKVTRPGIDVKARTQYSVKTAAPAPGR